MQSQQDWLLFGTGVWIQKQAWLLACVASGLESVRNIHHAFIHMLDELQGRKLLMWTIQQNCIMLSQIIFDLFYRFRWSLCSTGQSFMLFWGTTTAPIKGNMQELTSGIASAWEIIALCPAHKIFYDIFLHHCVLRMRIICQSVHIQ